MFGITAMYPYIPRHRVDVSSIHEAWGKKGKKGLRAFSNYDEDSLTMAINTISSYEHFSGDFDFLIFSTTSNPFIEGNGSNILANVIGLKEDCHLYDMNQTLRSGVKGIELGLSLLETKKHNSGLIIAADNRSCSGGSDLETLLSDGACAIEIGNTNVVAEIKNYVAYNDFTFDTWQLNGQESLKQGDVKFSFEQARKSIIKVGQEIFKRAKLTPSEIDCLIVSSQHVRLKASVAKELGVMPEKMFSSELENCIGYTGVSAPFLALNEALLRAKPDEKILLIHEGSGVDGFLVNVTAEVETFKKTNRLLKMVEDKIEIKNYQQFLVQKGEKSRHALQPFSTTILELRERKNNYQLKAQKCLKCGSIHFPARNNCSTCLSREEMEWFSLRKHGTIYTFTHDYLFPGENIATTMAVIDLDGGGRLFTQLTDYERTQIKIGDRVQLSFRKVHEGSAFPNYFWKAVPIKEEE